MNSGIGFADSSDSVLRRKIFAHLAETNRPNLRSLAVQVAEGNVTVRGQVASFYERQLAIQACLGATGTGLVTDAVEVVVTT